MCEHGQVFVSLMCVCVCVCVSVRLCTCVYVYVCVRVCIAMYPHSSFHYTTDSCDNNVVHCWTALCQ